MQKSSIFLTGVAAIVVIVVSCTYTVAEYQRAIMLQLGEIKETSIDPGLHFKIPFINTIRYFDARIQTLDAPPERYLTSEKKNVEVDAFIKWRIADVARFYTATGGGDVRRANLLLSQIIKDGLRDEFGKRTMQEVISGERSQVMNVISAKASKQADEIGIDVVQVRIKRIDLSADISDSVYRRMEAERQRVANELRSQGAEAGERIRAEAERKRTILLAEAFRDSEQLRGEGDAKASEIYAKAYSKNPEFYALYRSLDAYTKTFADKGDIMIIDPQSEFFRYMMNPAGK
ncbi:MAG: protease modulator HflC [Gammaproteobacteria bacterium]|nr:protease modulator HflC [Gammaproteobacteria bacterium]MCF6229697.1 protease modulator HflC [Gammaproteobacteria bacterium]